MTRAVGINHVALEVGDLEEALAFYGRIFDLSLRGRHGSSMAFIDLGDQFIALSVGGSSRRTARGTSASSSTTAPRRLPRRAKQARTCSRDNDFLDPWGNHIQVVDYRDVQFTKTDRVMEGMGLAGLEKRPRAVAELRAKGLAD